VLQLLLQVNLTLLHFCSQVLLVLLHCNNMRRFDAARRGTMSPRCNPIMGITGPVYG
jgi:hypothetical protein